MYNKKDGMIKEVTDVSQEESVVEHRPSPPNEAVFNSLQEHNVSRELSSDWAIFNTAALANVFLTRAIYLPDVQEEVPDRNVIVACVKDEKGQWKRFSDLNLPTNGKVFNWEDPRAGSNSTIGMTAVCQENDGSYTSHPALIEVEIEGNEVKVGKTRIFDEKGKNVLPLEDNTFLYRPEGETHKLHLVKPDYTDHLNVIKEIDFSAFSNINWMRKKIGLVARPLDLKDDRKLFFIHGVREGTGLDGKDKDDIYAIGIALMDKNWNVLAVDSAPLFERKDFVNNLPLKEDLNPKKEVVYLCDYQEAGEDIIFPVNVGERIIVFTHYPKASAIERALGLLSKYPLVV